jgi:putative endonuclease
MGKYPGKMTTKRQMLGSRGEQAVADFLSGQGYEILARNVRTPRGEIDLVVRSGEVIIFVEVRTRTSSKFTLPEETITHRKQSHILAAVEDYILSHEIDHWQIDAIAIEGKPGSEPISLILRT